MTLKETKEIISSIKEALAKYVPQDVLDLKKAKEVLDMAETEIERTTIREVPEGYRYDTETKDFLVYRNWYTGHEILIERPTPIYRIDDSIEE